MLNYSKIVLEPRLLSEYIYKINSYYYTDTDQSNNDEQALLKMSLLVSLSHNVLVSDRITEQL